MKLEAVDLMEPRFVIRCEDQECTRPVEKSRLPISEIDYHLPPVNDHGCFLKCAVVMQAYMCSYNCESCGAFAKDTL